MFLAGGAGAAYPADMVVNHHLAGLSRHQSVSGNIRPSTRSLGAIQITVYSVGGSTVERLAPVERR